MRPPIRYLSACALIFAVLAGAISGFATRSHAVNVLLCFCCFVAYTYIAFAAFALRPRLLRLVVGGLLSLPVAVSILASPLIFAGVVWALNDFAAGPDAVIHMADGLLCQEYSSGSAVTEANETFELDRPVLGIFQLRLAANGGPILESYSAQEGCASLYENWMSPGKPSVAERPKPAGLSLTPPGPAVRG